MNETDMQEKIAEIIASIKIDVVRDGNGVYYLDSVLDIITEKLAAIRDYASEFQMDCIRDRILDNFPNAY